MPPLVAAAAVLYVTATLLFVVLMTRHEPRHIYGTLATIVIGVAAWPLVGRGRPAAC